MRISPRRRETAVALLFLTTQASAIAMSDFTPKTTNLPARCNTVYTATIPGCTVTDFQNSVCSKACLAGLVQVNALVANYCQSADVEETSIIGLFKLGKAIQVLCNVAVVTTTIGLGAVTTAVSVSVSLMPMPMPTLVSSQTITMALSLTEPVSMTDSSTTKPTTSPASVKQSTTLSATQQISAPSSSIINAPPLTTVSPSKAGLTSASKTSTSPAEAQSIRSGNTHSGGGSPFDNIDNSGAASLHNSVQLTCGAVASLVLGGYLALM